MTKAPQESLILAQSNLCPAQALQVGDKAFSMQFHIEITDEAISDWAKVPEYQQSLEKTLGLDAIDAFQKNAADHMQHI